MIFSLQTGSRPSKCGAKWVELHPRFNFFFGTANRYCEGKTQRLLNRELSTYWKLLVGAVSGTSVAWRAWLHAAGSLSGQRTTQNDLTNDEERCKGQEREQAWATALAAMMAWVGGPPGVIGGLAWSFCPCLQPVSFHAAGRAHGRLGEPHPVATSLTTSQCCAALGSLYGGSL